MTQKFIKLILIFPIFNNNSLLHEYLKQVPTKLALKIKLILFFILLLEENVVFGFAEIRQIYATILY